MQCLYCNSQKAGRTAASEADVAQGRTSGIYRHRAEVLEWMALPSRVPGRAGRMGTEPGLPRLRLGCRERAV